LLKPTIRLLRFPVSSLPAFSQTGLSSSYGIPERFLVSKNVCHGVVYDHDLHEELWLHCHEAKASPQLDRLQDMVSMMAMYLYRHPGGKMFHDPLAAAAMIDPSVCYFEEVEVYRSRGEWGSKLAKGTRTFISVSVDKARFVEVLKGKS
jgi:pyrimidine-specific ribonucleoside hydrolase